MVQICKNVVDQYLRLDSSKLRMSFLQKLIDQRQTMPLPLTIDLMHGKLHRGELISLISACDASQKLAFEDFVTRGIYLWEQNVASLALRLWAEKTDCLLWHRTMPLVFDEHVLQRVSYTLLDLAWHSGGRKLLEAFINKSGLAEMSPAFWALFYHRAILWNFECEPLVDIGLRHIHSMKDVGFDGDKVIPQIVAYFLKFRPEILHDHNTKLQITGTWGDIIKSLQQQTIDQDFIDSYMKTMKACQKSAKNLAGFYINWPSAWHRGQLSSEFVGEFMKVLGKHELTMTPNQTPMYEMLGGVPSVVLAEALVDLREDLVFAHCLSVTGNLLLEQDEKIVLDSLIDRLQKCSDPVPVLERLPQRLRIKLGDFSSGVFNEINSEAMAFECVTKFGPPREHFTFVAKVNRLPEDSDRFQFIRTAYFGERSREPIENEFWQQLRDSWLSPSEDRVDGLAQVARQAPAAFNIFYIETLARFQGIDKAALKLLDYVRSEESEVIAAVIQALAGIGTTRATQEIVAFLTRPNITFDLQMDIAQILKDKDLTHLQSELRSAIDDVHIDPHYENMQWELRATLSDLLLVPSALSDVSTLSSTDANHPAMPTSAELDQLLVTKFKDYPKLSSEAKRALRTAQFFHLQVMSAGGLQTIDLSPCIDMQYKALELSFRENFEGPCSILINDGILQRKLDLIGYARPIKANMDRFEAYIESLPIIENIPFFSRFKLRKMLRALCQFRRGKRFTLDGLKAFGLFFICFSRKKCEFGLANLFPVADIEDDQLAEFVTILHTFQDFRNRAAHEGFHPDASNNLEAIWQDTIRIVESMFSYRDRLKIDASHQAVKPVKDVIVENKTA